MREENKFRDDKTLEGLIYNIKLRAGAFLGNEQDLKALRHFIDGYLYTKNIYNQLSEFEQHFRTSFVFFVENELQDDGVFTWDWDKTITLHSPNDADALNRFFDFFEKFSQQYNTIDS